MSVKTIKVNESLHDRLTEAKPWDSLSYGEFIGELLDHYQAENTPEARA